MKFERTLTWNGMMMMWMYVMAASEMIISYEGLRESKAKVNTAFDLCEVWREHRRTMMAMAMLETKGMTIEERDYSKDNRTDGSANVSIFNLNIDMIRQLGYNGDIKKLDESITDAVCLIKKAFKEWGVRRTLHFVRGGGKGFMDGVSYDAEEYISVITRIMNAINEDSQLMYDDRRVEIYLKHV